MATHPQALSIQLPVGFDAQSEYEMRFRGSLPDVIVELADGTRRRLSFIDASRLEQSLADNVSIGQPYYGEPGLVVLPEVTLEAIEKAVHGLEGEGYFDRIPSFS